MAFNSSAALLLILLGLVLLALSVWIFMRFTRKARVTDDGMATPLTRDVLDEGAERARRNQALIDAAPAAVTQAPPAAPAPTAAPVTVTPTPAPEPAPTPAPTPAPARAPAAADDLTRIKGVGPKLLTLLGELGVTTYAQIAAWSDADVERIDAQLGRFKGRITRDQWIAQARLLAAGDEAAFTDTFGRNG